jgi:bifunctional UDP-N-acetylglucosamine pyrophosphorylase/glucosamine-1-phosphate N-acetyltransferase
VQERPLGTGDSLARPRSNVGDARTCSSSRATIHGSAPSFCSDLRRRAPLDRRDRDVLSFEPDDPRAYGRIVRGAGGRLVAIVEDADANDVQRALREVNSSIYVFAAEKLWPVLERIEPANAQGELYLTDAVRLLVEGGEEVIVFKAPIQRRWKG